jgi:two-component system sensor histidine kinase UhpB
VNPSIPTHPRRLLLVEDNPGDAELVAELLHRRHPSDTLIEVETLAAAAEALRHHTVDGVLLDLRLPDGTGVTCVSTIAALAPGVAIVVLTGLEDEAIALSCIAAGAQDYLAKDTLSAENLHRAVGYALARVQELAQRRRADVLQAHLAAIVESSHDGIVSCSPDGRVTSWNRGAESIFGYSAEEAVGQPVDAVIRRVDLGASPPVAFDTPSERTHVRKDGRAITVSRMESRLRGPGGVDMGTATICRDVTESRLRDAELRTRNAELTLRDQQMRALTARLLAVREEERARISRTVHDELGQLLTGLKMDLRWIARRLGTEGATEAVTARLVETDALADSTLATVQQIAIELRPSALDTLGLSAALHDEARRYSRRSGIHTTVEVTTDEPLPPETATALFRIFQELLTNVARHAHATHVRVALTLEDEHWTLEVADDGVGLGRAEADGLSSLGLLGIRERAHALGGTFELGGRARQGTTARVQIPRRQAESPHAHHPDRR